MEKGDLKSKKKAKPITDWPFRKVLGEPLFQHLSPLGFAVGALNCGCDKRHTSYAVFDSRKVGVFR